MGDQNRKRGLGKSLSDLGLAALLGGDLKPSATNSTSPQPSSGATDKLTPTQFDDQGMPLSASEPQTEHHTLHTQTPSDEHSNHQPHAQANNHPHDSLQQLAIDQLQPGRYQPRRHMQEDPLQELTDSIKQQGVIQPIVVRKLPDDSSKNHTPYEIVAGERRWRAAQQAELTHVPVVIRELDDRTTLAVALIENLQREDLNAIDQAVALQRMINEFDLTHLEIAEIVGKSRASISNLLRLLNLDPDVQKLVQQGDLEMGHGRALLAAKRTAQAEIAELIISRSLTVRQTEKYIQQQNTPNSSSSIGLDLIAPHLKLQLERMQKSISTSLSCKVILQSKSNKPEKGKLILHYDNQLQLEEIAAKLTDKQK